MSKSKSRTAYIVREAYKGEPALRAAIAHVLRKHTAHIAHLELRIGKLKEELYREKRHPVPDLFFIEDTAETITD